MCQNLLDRTFRQQSGVKSGVGFALIKLCFNFNRRLSNRILPDMTFDPDFTRENDSKMTLK